MATWFRILAGIMGFALQIMVLDAAIRTFLLPRVARVRLTRFISQAMGRTFYVISRFGRSYVTQDRILSLGAPITLLTFQALWLALSVVAFAFGFIAAGAPNFAAAFQLSGSSLFTLGTSAAHGGGQVALSYLEAGVGLTLLALLIAFVPTIYAAFQRREFSVSRLAVRSGMPATPWGVIEIAQSVFSYDILEELWREWEQWFIELGETHTTLTILNYYRSPSAEQTWIGAASTVLDAAALYNAVVDLPPSSRAGLCIRSGWIALRHICDYFRIPYPTEPNRSIPIAVTREEFDLVLDHLRRSGVPLVADVDAAWWDFVGWRVNYDAMIEAFYTQFSSPRTDWRLALSQPLYGRSNQRGVRDT